MSRFLNARYQPLQAYVPGEQPRDAGWVKLNTNESPYAPAEGVVRAAAEAAAGLNLYSDPTCALLRDALAERYGVKRENICAVNGSDEALNFAFMAFGGRGAVFPDITYGFYPVFCQLHGIPFREIPLKADFSIDPAEYLGVNGLVVIANPNAPTGMALPVAEIERILRGNPDGVVLVDEAYVDFGGESCMPLVEKYENLLVVRTFSKSRSLAGARLGFAVGQKALIDDLEKLRYSTNPYNINSMTLAAGRAALMQDDYYMENCAKIAATREATRDALTALGFDVLPSQGNFLFAAHGCMPGEAVNQALRKRRVLVRHFAKERIAGYNRITIGTPQQMRTLVEALRDIVSEGEKP